MTANIEKVTQALRDALKEIEGLISTDQQVLLQQAQKAQQDLAYAQFRVQELQRARDDLVIQRNEETARADSLERQVMTLKTQHPQYYSDWHKLLVKIAEVAGDQDPEGAVDDEFDPWDTLDGIAQDKQRLRDRGDVARQQADAAEKTILKLRAERTGILARNLKTWEEARVALKATRTAQKERDAAVLSRAAAERQVADIKAEWDLVRAEVEKLRGWKQQLPQSHWFIERQRLQDKVEDQTAHLEASRKDLEFLVQQRGTLQIEVAKAQAETARQYRYHEEALQALGVANRAVETAERERLALQDRLGIDAPHPDGLDIKGVREQNGQLVQAILGLHRAQQIPVDQDGPEDVTAAWRACWQAVSATGFPPLNDIVPTKQETVKAPAVKRASRSPRTKKPKV